MCIRDRILPAPIFPRNIHIVWIINTVNQTISNGASLLRLDVSSDSVRLPANHGVVSEVKDAIVSNANANRNLFLKGFTYLNASLRPG